MIFRYEDFLQQKYLLIAGFVLIGGVLIYQSIPQEKPVAVEENWSIDTLIPKGLVLLPIRIQNIENVSALIGSSAVVDLWSSANQESNKKPQKIASQIKMVRAPLDPNVFAIVVTENESQEILLYGDTFYVTVHNPEQNASTINPKQQPKNKVQFETFQTQE
jgi:uncharacterized protein YqcC (DUF446 family)